MGASIPQNLEREVDRWKARSMVELGRGDWPADGPLRLDHYRKYVGEPYRMGRNELKLQSLEQGGGLAIAVAMGAAQLRRLAVHRSRHGVALRHGGHADCFRHRHIRHLHGCDVRPRVQLGADIHRQCGLRKKQRHNEAAGNPATPMSDDTSNVSHEFGNDSDVAESRN